MKMNKIIKKRMARAYSIDIEITDKNYFVSIDDLFVSYAKNRIESEYKKQKNKIPGAVKQIA